MKLHESHNAPKNHEESSHQNHSHQEHSHDDSNLKHSDHDHSGHHHSHQEHSHGDSNHQHSDHGHSGHDHSGHSLIYKNKFMRSLVLGIPILFLSPMMGITLPFQFSFPGSDEVVVILATLLFFYGGQPFLSGARNELKAKNPAMMTLVSLGIIVAYIYSLGAYVNNTLFHANGHVMDFFWELSSLILIMLLGHWIEMDAITNAGNALQSMAELLPSEATRIDTDGKHSVHPLNHIQIGDVLLVKAGENMPTDGTIIEGASLVNESMITGESRDVAKVVGDHVIGGSSNGSGTLHIKVTGTGSSGYLAQVMSLVEQASQDKSKVETLADTVAKWLFYIAITVGFITFVVWTWLGGLTLGTERMVTVLVIACPHALGLAIPLVVARSTSLGAQNGLLVKSRQALEVAQHVDVLMMDKTGTLTEGQFDVRALISNNEQYSESKVLELFAALEQSSSHPLAVGILKKANDEGVIVPSAQAVQNLPGIGITGTVNQEEVKVVSVRYLINNTIAYDEAHFNELAQQGYSISYLLVNDTNVGLIAQGDKIKEDALDIIKTLKERGIQPVMLTGDNQQSADVVGRYLGIEDVQGDLLPEDKERIVKEYQSRGLKVIMVGDGVNDAPSLMRANVGIAIGAGTDVAIDAADVILVKSNPSDIVHFLDLAYNTSRKMKQNLWWGAGYNFIAIPLAAGVLAGVGFILTPAVGAILMSSSTVIVALNALLLKIK